MVASYRVQVRDRFRAKHLCDRVLAACAEALGNSTAPAAAAAHS